MHASELKKTLPYPRKLPQVGGQNKVISAINGQSWQGHVRYTPGDQQQGVEQSQSLIEAQDSCRIISCYSLLSSTGIKKEIGTVPEVHSPEELVPQPLPVLGLRNNNNKKACFRKEKMS
ncbi:unnamed protein product [Polarella glacialis]|uniref:Uncharacterized protein n=1 Tax=Polarella glacialis TaxID=89957 RepID=A0A813HCQ5_POLGL|nr:unnamed protein product [Polarella glacialis]